MIWVAEIGSNHKGILSLAHELIRQSALAGATVVKFQFRDPRDRIRGMPMHNASDLAEACDHYGVQFMASVFSFEALELARSLRMPWLKIANSVAMSDPVLCDKIASGSEMVFVSHDKYKFLNWKNIFVVPLYPTYPSMIEMPEKFDEFFGYSSHMHGYADALIAIARGAQYVEKHVTTCKAEASIKDNHFSLTLDEFRAMVNIGAEMAALV